MTQNRAPDEIADSLTACGVIIRRGKSGSVLSIDFRQATAVPQSFAISSLAAFERLRELHLQNCQVRSDDMTALCTLQRLQTLSLQDCDIDEQTIGQLRELTGLKLLLLSASQVSEQFLASFRKVMIATRIVVQ